MLNNQMVTIIDQRKMMNNNRVHMGTPQAA